MPMPALIPLEDTLIPLEEDQLQLAAHATTIKSYGDEEQVLGYNDDFTKFGKRCCGHSLR